MDGGDVPARILKVSAHTNLMYSFIQCDCTGRKRHRGCRGKLQREVEEDRRERD